MKQLLRLTVGCLALGALAVATGPAQADSPGPYYATPSWDQTLPAATRFIVLSNFAGAAVLDRETGLVWEKSPGTTPPTLTWFQASYVCMLKNVGGRKGWRSPSIPELASLIDPSVSPGPTLPPGHPFIGVSLQSAFYWSSTTTGELANQGWFVNFALGIPSTAGKDLLFNAWCVRGGMNADVY